MYIKKNNDQFSKYVTPVDKISPKLNLGFFQEYPLILPKFSLPYSFWYIQLPKHGRRSIKVQTVHQSVKRVFQECDQH